MKRPSLHAVSAALALRAATRATIEPMPSSSVRRLAALAVAIRGALRDGPRPRKNAADERV